MQRILKKINDLLVLLEYIKLLIKEKKRKEKRGKETRKINAIKTRNQLVFRSVRID